MVRYAFTAEDFHLIPPAGLPAHPSTPSREPEGAGQRYGVNPKTVAKWKARSSVSDLPTGPKQPRSTVLSAEERRAKRFGAKTLAPYGSAACSALARRYSLWRWIDARIKGKRNVYARSGLQSRSAEILCA